MIVGTELQISGGPVQFFEIATTDMKEDSYFSYLNQNSLN